MGVEGVHVDARASKFIFKFVLWLRSKSLVLGDAVWVNCRGRRRRRRLTVLWSRSPTCSCSSRTRKPTTGRNTRQWTTTNCGGSWWRNSTASANVTRFGRHLHYIPPPLRRQFGQVPNVVASLLLLGPTFIILSKKLIAPSVMLHLVSGISSLCLFVNLILAPVPSSPAHL